MRTSKYPLPLPLALSGVFLIGFFLVGCGSTERTKQADSYSVEAKGVRPANFGRYRSEINKRGLTTQAQILLLSGEKMKVQELTLKPDSALGMTDYGLKLSVATPRIDKITFIDREARRKVEYNFAHAGVNWSEVKPNSAEKQTAINKRTSKDGSRQVNQTRVAESKASEKVPNEEVTDKEARGKAEPTRIVDAQVPKTSMKRPDDIAVVIGNRKYKNGDIPKVDYSVRDARIMKKYLTRTLGFWERNIIYLKNASGSAMERGFGTGDDPIGQLHDWVKPEKSSVFVYYSGHGAPNPETGNAYLLPSNANPSYLSQNGYPLSQLYENLSKLPAPSITVVLEACFSGTSEGGAVVQNASPAVLSVENPVMGIKNGLAFTAAATDQVASWYPEKKHGLFTYFFLKGLRGNADSNRDKAVTAKEMESYLNNKVPYRAQRMHSRKQTPVIAGQNMDRVLVRYDERPPAAKPKATLPVTTTSVQPSVKQALSLPDGAVKVTAVRGTEALQKGDVITAAGGSDLTSKGRLSEIVGNGSPGDTLDLKILREGNSRTVSVTLTTSK